MKDCFILDVLKKHCPTPRITDVAKRELSELGFRVLGYNYSCISKEVK